MTDGETPGDRLTAAMKRARLKNAAIAAAAGVHVKTVSYWRSDRQRPEERQLERVAELLRHHGVDVSAASLRYGEEKKQRIDSGDVFGALELDVRTKEHQLQILRAGASPTLAEAARQLMMSREAALFYAAIRGSGEVTHDDRLSAVDLVARFVLTIVADVNERATGKATTSPPVDARPAYMRVAEQAGIGIGIIDLPADKKAAIAKKAAGASRKKPRR